MKKKAIIHIGTHKTGTTSIQSCLHSNRGRLNKNGWCVATPFGGPKDIVNAAYIWPCKTYFDPPLFPGENRLREYLIQRCEGADYSELLQHGINKFSELRDNSFILSFEDLSDPNLLRFRRKLNMLKELLSPLQPSHEISIIVYYRRQDIFLESLYSTIQSNMYHMSFEEYSSKLFPFTWGPQKDSYDLNWLNHSKVLNETFKEVCIHEFSYDIVTQNENIISHFLRVLDLDYLQIKIPKKSENVRTNPAVVQMLHYSNLSEEQSNAMHSVLTHDCPEFLTHELKKYSLMQADFRKKMLEYYAPLNKKLFGCSDQQYEDVFAPPKNYLNPLKLGGAFSLLAQFVANKEMVELARRKMIIQSVPVFLRRLIPRFIKKLIYNSITFAKK